MDHSTKIKRKPHPTRLWGQRGAWVTGSQESEQKQAAQSPTDAGELQAPWLIRESWARHSDFPGAALLPPELDNGGQKHIRVHRYFQILTRNKSIKWRKHGPTPTKMAKIKKRQFQVWMRRQEPGTVSTTSKRSMSTRRQLNTIHSKPAKMCKNSKCLSTSKQIHKT